MSKEMDTPDATSTAEPARIGQDAETANRWTSVPADSGPRFEMIRNVLYTPVIGDVLDVLGLRHQFLPPDIRAMKVGYVVVGRAMPVLMADVFGPQRRPFGRLTEALDSLVADEVYVANCGRTPVAAWGEIMTATAKRNGAAGAVLDGYHRDTPQVLAQDFPVFSRGAYAKDAAVRTTVLDYRIAIEIGAVLITPGDLVVGDHDGVVVVPRAVEDEVLQRALDKAATESLVLQAIRDGMSATDAVEKFGVL